MRSVHTIPFDFESGPGSLCAIVHDSGRDGPRVAVTANVHGDEVTGLASVLALDEWLGDHLERGAVYLYPTLNPVGLKGCHRALTQSGADLNRLFPGNARGDHGNRLAATIWSELKGLALDLVLDLHADSCNAIPYAIVDRAVALTGPERAVMQERLCAMAAATGFTVLTEYLDEKYRRFELDKSLAGAMVNREGIPALTIECGPRRAIAPDSVHTTALAVRGVLGHLGAVSFETVCHPTRVSGTFRRSSPPRIGRAGVFLPVLAPGLSFDKGAILGRIAALDGSIVENIVASSAGLVISWVEASWVQRHGVVGTLGIPE